MLGLASLGYSEHHLPGFPWCWLGLTGDGSWAGIDLNVLGMFRTNWGLGTVGQGFNEFGQCWA